MAVRSQRMGLLFRIFGVVRGMQLPIAGDESYVSRYIIRNQFLNRGDAPARAHPSFLAEQACALLLEMERAMPESQNVLFYGDNLDILRHHIATESVDLIYLDPPFNSNRAYNVLFVLLQSNDERVSR